MSLPDYSTWLTPERLRIEEDLWSKDVAVGAGNVIAATQAQQLIDARGIKTVLELGCGTGWVPHLLRNVQYTGLDANPGCLELARAKNPAQTFVGPVDFRTWAPDRGYDLACTFSVLKHFRLDEWINILAKLLSLGQHGLVTVTIAAEAKDDGTEFTHTWVTWEHVYAACRQAGHTLVNKHLFWSGPPGEDYFITTHRDK